MRQRPSSKTRSRRSSTIHRRRDISLEGLEDRMLLTQLQYGLFDTGVDSSGNVLAGGSSDPHYTMPATQQGTAGMNAVVVSSLAGGWLANSATDAWIAPTANEASGESSPGGAYQYHTTFNLPAGSGSSGQFTGGVTSDNSLTDFQVNGVSTGYTSSNFGSYVSFRVDGGLVPGTNTLDFFVTNDGAGPTGFHAENLALNFLPTVASDNATEIVYSGQTVTNTGTFAESNAGDPVTITSSRGTVTQSGTNSGTYAYSESDVTAGGPVTITATNSEGGTSTATFNIDVIPPTRTTLAASAPSITLGSSVTLTATVTNLSEGSTPTGGTVTFNDGSSVLGTAPLVNGTATYTTSALPLGLSRFTASYGGTGSFSPSTMALSPTSPIATYAGTGTSGYTGDGGPATGATLENPTDVILDPAGDLFIADQSTHVIREVTTDGIIKTIAGNGTAGYTGDGGPAIDAEIGYPYGLALDPAGDLYIADRGMHVVREVTTDGNIHTVAGTGTPGNTGNGGPALMATLNVPEGIALDAAGNLFIAEQGNSDIREVTTDGKIHIAVGTGIAGNTGDGGPATAATLNIPSNLTVDASGDLFIVDQHNARIREVSAKGIITAFAGTGTPGYAGDGGPATAAEINNNAEAIVVDSVGNVYFADYLNNVIREVTTDGIIHTVVGTGAAGYSGDGGPANAAKLHGPYGVAVDTAGDLYIGDNGSSTVRVVNYSVPVNVTPPPPTLTAGGGPASTARTGGSGVVVDPGLTLVDKYGPNLTTASISIDANFTPAEDLLLFTAQNGITGNYNASTGILTLSGSATPAQYQAALRSVEYQDTNVTATANVTPRTISFSIAPGAFDSANGHFYQFVSDPGITWFAAQAAAAASNIYGIQGYLATITSQAEDTFAFSKTQTSGWIGASDPLNNDIWRWADGPESGLEFWTGQVNGSPFNGAYSNWDVNQPDHAGGTEAYAQFVPDGRWNDLNSGYPINGYLIEYGGSVGDPTLQLTSSATVNVSDLTDTPTITTPAAATSVNAPNYTLTGTADAGSLVKVYNDVNHNGTVDLGELVVGTEQLGDAQTSYSIPVPLAQSSHNYFLVTATVSPIKESVPAVAPTLTADSTPPMSPTVTSPTAPTSIDSATVTITGTAEANSLVQIYVGNTVVASEQLTGGATSYSIAAPLTPNAVNQFAVTATDAAGNQSASTAVPALTEDSLPPAAPGVTSPSVPSSVNTLTTTISGTAEAGSLVKIYGDTNHNGSIDDGEVVVGLLQLAPGQTSYSITVPLMRNAPNDFLVTDTDAAGNQSSPTVVPTISEDSIPPVAPVVLTPAAALAVNAGAATITGTAEANSLVKVYKDFNDNGSIDIGDVVVGFVQLTGGATAYSITVPLDQNSANHFLVTATDAASNPSSPVAVPTITEDSTTPPDPRVISPAVPVLVNTPTAPITGVALADSLVQVYEDLNDNGAIDPGDLVVASEQLTGGASSFSIPTPLALNADNHFLVTATNAAGTQSPPVMVPAIAQDSIAPAAPTVTTPSVPQSINAATIPITGTAEAGSLVQIYDGMVVVGSEQLAAGQTSYAITVPLVQNTPDNFLVTATDAAGNQSVPVAVPTITAKPMIRGTVYLDLNASGSLDAGESGLSGRVVFLDLKHDGVLDAGDPTTTTDAGGNFSFPGVATGSATVLEAADQDATDRYVVDQTTTNADGSLAIGVVPISPVAPVPVVPGPFSTSPSTDANTAYVQSLYAAVLGRGAADSEVIAWLVKLDTGMSREQVAMGFINSLEHRQDQVVAYYQEFLHRAPDPTSVNWVDDLLAGVSEETVVRGFLDSPEYQAAHQDSTLFIQDLYLDVLGRQGESTGVAGWQAALGSGASREAITAAFVGSAEANDQIVESFYTSYLHRQREQTTSDLWVESLAGGDSATDVAIGILASDEFHQDSKVGGL